MQAVGIFGGTFDPIHIGHLRTALELREHLAVDEMRLLPCANPPHRQAPLAAARHRLAMLKKAIAGEPALRVDDQELHRPGPSYSIDTLIELRGELGAKASLCLCIGMDALLGLDSWHRWRELTDYAHLVVVARPGWPAPAKGHVASWLNGRQTLDIAALRQTPAGRVLFAEMTLLPVAARDIRANLACGRSVRYLVPDAVIDYINEHNLYQGTA